MVVSRTKDSLLITMDVNSPLTECALKHEHSFPRLFLVRSLHHFASQNSARILDHAREHANISPVSKTLNWLYQSLSGQTMASCASRETIVHISMCIKGDNSTHLLVHQGKQLYTSVHQGGQLRSVGRTTGY